MHEAVQGTAPSTTAFEARMIVCEKHEPGNNEIAKDSQGKWQCLVCIKELFLEWEMVATQPCPQCGADVEVDVGYCSRCEKVGENG